jgi:hypothetical protein
MAKDNRFPAPANPKKVVEKKEEPKAPVIGKHQPLVELAYSEKNHHVLHGGVYALRNGLNHVPVDAWEAAKAHPSMQAMLKSGQVKVISEPTPVDAEDGDSEISELKKGSEE